MTLNHAIPLAITNLSKTFAEKKVLDKVNLSVKPGEIFGLIGLNGVGKTTMIKIILDLLDPDQGTVEFFGESSKIPESRNKISYLPEKFYPSAFLHGEEFLSLALSYYGVQYNRNLAEKLAAILELDKKMLDDKISKYSKGMAQKLGLMSVFMSKAPLLILDEPMSGLDPRARIQLKELLLDYSRKGGSIFFSSHILSDIEEICTTIAILNDKNIIYHGSPAKIIRKNESLERAFLKMIKQEYVPIELLNNEKPVKLNANSRKK